MTSREDLKKLIDFLRSEGVLSYEENGIRLTLSPARPPEFVDKHENKIPTTERDSVFKMTADERLDLFNDPT